jgi:hypothetical protein
VSLKRSYFPQAAVKQTGNVGMYTATFRVHTESQERLDDIREHLVHLGDLGRDTVVDSAVADLYD